MTNLLPLLYGLCFIALLIQAFRVMGRGFRAAGLETKGPTRATAAGDGGRSADRTGCLTIHPELLDDDGQLTREDLLTVRFSGDNEQPASAGEPS
jgi:hypothetical protein